MEDFSAVMLAMGSEMQALIRKLVAAEVAIIQKEVKEQLVEVKDALEQVKRREERADYVHVQAVNSDQDNAGAPMEGRVCVQVGGEKFFTTAEVLRGTGHPDLSVRDSYLAALLSGRWQSSLFIARSPESFAFVLEYLTYHTLHNKPTDQATLSLLMHDLDFYGLTALHSELSVSINSLTCVGIEEGVRRWNRGPVQRSLVDVENQQIGLNEDGRQVIIHRPGFYLIALRDQQEANDGCRKVILHKNEHPKCTSYQYATDGRVCAQLVDIQYLKADDSLSVHSDAPCNEALSSSMFMVRLDHLFFETWRYIHGVFQHQHVENGLSKCATSLDNTGNASETIFVEQDGQYILVVSMSHTKYGERSLTLHKNGLAVSKSYVNTGGDNLSVASQGGCATLLLMEVIQLAVGDRLKLECEHLCEDNDNRLQLVRLDSHTSRASWQATGHEGSIAKWGKLLLQHDDYSTSDNGTKIQVVCKGCYLVMVRLVHGGNRHKKLDLLQNSVCIARCLVSTDGSHRNCGHIVEVLEAGASDTFSVEGESLEDDVLYSNFSIIRLQ